MTAAMTEVAELRRPPVCVCLCPDANYCEACEGASEGGVVVTDVCTPEDHRGACACSCGWVKPGRGPAGAPLIGLLGRKRAGKDSFAAELVDRHGFVRVAFADPLKETMLDLDPIIRIDTDELGPLRPEFNPRPGGAYYVDRLAGLVKVVGWERAKEVREVRRLLQAHGVAIREHVGENVWVDAAMTAVALWRSGDMAEDLGCGCCFEPAGPTPVVITDVRFPNEAAAIKAAGGSLIRIIRPGQDTLDDHISETALDDWPADREVWNTGTLDDLRWHADAAVEMLCTPR